MAGLSAKGASSENDFKGFTPVEPGVYHAYVVDTLSAEENDRINADTVHFQILGGKVPGQEGRQVRGTYFRDKETNEFQDQHVRLAMATKFMLPGQEVGEFNVSMLQGRQCIIRVAKNKEGYTDIGNKGFDVWGIDNPEVADVPKDQNAIQQFVTWCQQQGITIQMPTAAPAQAQAAQPSNGNGQQHAAAAGPPTSFGSV